jgi:hypothetical protein
MLPYAGETDWIVSSKPPYGLFVRNTWIRRENLVFRTEGVPNG